VPPGGGGFKDSRYEKGMNVGSKEEKKISMCKDNYKVIKITN
jgi:hypothetical protein